MEQYISKSALLAEIERLVNNYDKALDYEAALEDVRNFLDTLKVKEVDLDFEIKEDWLFSDKTEVDCFESMCLTEDMFVSLAKKYFELGLEAQKGVDPQVKESAEIQHDKETCKENGNSLTKEPVSEDLEKAAVEAFKQIVDSDKNSFLEIFKAGAKWQETKDKQILNEEGVVILPEEEFERMKRSLIKLAEREQQMMAKAVDGVVTFGYYGGDKAYGCVAHDSFCLEDLGLEDRDEVKILILKK